MKKVLIFVLTVLTAGQLAFAGGGGQSGRAAGTKTLSWYSWYADSERIMADALASDFMAAHPNIKIEQNHNFPEYLSRINTMIASGNTPDVYLLNEYLHNEWGEKGVAEDLYPFFQRAGIDPDKFYDPGALYKTGNHLWGVNTTSATIVLYYNKELFRQAGVTPPPDSATNPWTWDQFVAAAKKLTKDSQGRTPNDPGFNYEQVVQYGTLLPTSNWIFWLPLLYSAGTSFADENGTSLAMTGPAGTDMIQKIANLALVDKVSPTFAMSRSSAFSTHSTLLMNGQLAMFIGGVWEWPEFGNEKYDVGISQLPSVIGKGNNITWGAGFQLKKGGSQEAFDLLLYMTNFNNWVKACKNHNLALEGGLPQTNSTYTDPVLNAEWRAVFDPTMGKVAGDIIQNAARVGENVTLKNFAELLTQITVAELDKVWLGEETAQQAMQNLTRQTQGKFQGVWK